MNGRTTVEAKALQRLALAIASDASRVPSKRITVRLVDDSGHLKVVVELPAVVNTANPRHEITNEGRSGARGFAAQGEALREALIIRMAELGSRRVNTVNVHLSGVYRRNSGRVQ